MRAGRGLAHARLRRGRESGLYTMAIKFKQEPSHQWASTSPATGTARGNSSRRGRVA